MQNHDEIRENIIKQINLGFEPREIRKSLLAQGLASEEVDAALRNVIRQKIVVEGNKNIRVYAILMICAGVTLWVLVRPVSGELNFEFKGSGDITRWSQIVFQPLAAILLFVIGLVTLLRNKKITSQPLKWLGILLLIVTAFCAAYISNLPMTLLGLACIFLFSKGVGKYKY